MPRRRYDDDDEISNDGLRHASEDEGDEESDAPDEEDHRDEFDRELERREEARRVARQNPKKKGGSNRTGSNPWGETAPQKKKKGRGRRRDYSY